MKDTINNRRFKVGDNVRDVHRCISGKLEADIYSTDFPLMFWSNQLRPRQYYYTETGHFHIQDVGRETPDLELIEEATPEN